MKGATGKRIGENTIYLFAHHGITGIIGLAVGILVARYLGPEKLGILGYVVSFVGLFSIFVQFGLDTIVIRELALDKKAKERILGSALWLKLLGAGCGIASVLIVSTILGHDKQLQLFLFVASSVFVFQTLQVVDLWFQAEIKSKYVVVMKVMTTLIMALIKLGFVYFECSLFYFILSLVIEAVLLGVGFIYLYKIYGPHLPRWRFQANEASYLFSQAWPLIIVGGMVSIYMKIDQVMLREMVNNREVGLYNVAVRFSEVWYAVPVMIMASLFPILVQDNSMSETRFAERVKQIAYLMLWLSVSLAVIVTFASDAIIKILFGIQFSGAEHILSVHVWAHVFIFCGVLLSKIIIIKELQRWQAWFTGAGAVTNVAMNCWLIPLYGGVGAAIATVISHFTTVVLLPLLCGPIKRYVIFMMKSMLMPSIILLLVVHANIFLFNKNLLVLTGMVAVVMGIALGRLFSKRLETRR